MKFKLFSLSLLSLLSLLLSGPAADIAMCAPLLKVGTLGGPFEEVTNAAARAAPSYGLNIKPVILDGMISPNEMLAGGDLDANAYQHGVFLETDTARRGYDFIKIAELYQVPLAIYSLKHKTLQEVPDGGKIAIPADESNQSRALLALQDNGLIGLRTDVDWQKINANVDDVTENPHHFVFVEVPVTVLPKSLPDVDIGAVNALIAHQLAHLTLKDAIGLESPISTQRYTQLLVIRTADKNQPWVDPLVKAYHSQEVRNLMTTEFKDLMTPAF